ncbi:hypothetical protein Hanom_Chr16g01435741 [Helianthus anomalus]
MRICRFQWIVHACVSMWWPNSFLYLSSSYAPIWWYAKRFLHPDIVATYDYTLIWDEDLGFEHFNADKYIQMVKKHGLEISQPGLEPNNELTLQMTKWRGDKEVRNDPHLPPYAAFVEIMAPVFSRAAWRCVWHMIQGQSENDGEAPWKGVRDRCKSEWALFQDRRSFCVNDNFKNFFWVTT